MVDPDQPTTSSSDLKRSADVGADAQFDTSALALAAVFGTVSFPPGMPDYLKEAIRDHAELARNADSGFLIDQRMKSESERRRNVESDDDDNLSQLAQMVRQEHQEREREEWARTKSTVAGVTMTGTEWAQLAERFRNDSQLKEDVITAFRKRGMSEEEAERRYERVADVAAIAAKPESQRTEQEAEDFEKVKADPTFHQDMSDANAADKLRNPEVTTPRSTPFQSPELSANTTPNRTVVSLDGPAF